MSTILRMVLLIAAAFSMIWIMYRIRKSKVRLEDTLFWLGTAAILAFLGLFPQISYKMAAIFGFQSASNFVFLLMICLLFEKILTLSIMHSQLADKYVTLVAETALRCKDLESQVAALQEEIRNIKSEKIDEKINSD